MKQSRKETDPAAPLCEEPGCELAARWVLTTVLEHATAAHLCPHHWTLLRLRQPVTALSYTPIALVPGELPPSIAVVKTPSTPQSGDKSPAS